MSKAKEIISLLEAKNPYDALMSDKEFIASVKRTIDTHKGDPKQLLRDTPLKMLSAVIGRMERDEGFKKLANKYFDDDVVTTSNGTVHGEVAGKLYNKYRKESGKIILKELFKTGLMKKFMKDKKVNTDSLQDRLKSYKFDKVVWDEFFKGDK